MSILPERLNADSTSLNPKWGQRQDLQSVPSLPDSLDCSFSAFNMPGPQQQAPGFERTASISSVSTTSRINGIVPFAPQSANIQRGSTGAKVHPRVRPAADVFASILLCQGPDTCVHWFSQRDFAAVKAGEDTPLKRAKVCSRRLLAVPSFTLKVTGTQASLVVSACTDPLPAFRSLHPTH